MAQYSQLCGFSPKTRGKWFAVIGSVPRCKVDPVSFSAQEVEVINVKVGKDQIDTLLARDGIYLTFHMNKKCWVSIIFDDTVPDADIRRMVSESYEGSCFELPPHNLPHD